MNKKIKTLLIITICLSSLNLHACNLYSKEEKSSSRVLLATSENTFETVPVAMGNINPQISSRGSITSSEKSNLYTSLSGGTLDSLNFKVLDKVKKGDIIATFYSEDIDDEINLQKLNIRAKEIELSKLKSENASNYDIDYCQANLDIEKEKLAILNRKKERLIVKSPMDGIITNLTKANRGDQMTGKDLIAVVENAEDLVITGDINDSFINMYQVGMTASIEYNNRTYPGEVVDVCFQDNSELRKKRGVYVKFAGEFPDSMSLNSVVNLTLFSEEKENVMTVPTNSIHHDGQDFYVYVLNNSIKEKKIVQIGALDLKNAEVVSGLKLDEQIIIE